MSCGNPHEVDCQEVLARVSIFLDHGLSSRSGLGYDAIEQHLRECEPCLEEYGVHVEELASVVRTLLTRCCRNEHAPDELRLRVLHSIRVSMSTPDA